MVQDSTSPDRDESRRQNLLATLDGWAKSHPWNPRIGPWLVYMVFLVLIVVTREPLPKIFFLIKVLQLVTVCYLLWRWRKLTPELNWRFHWLSVPVGVGVCAVWIWLGKATARTFGVLDDGESYFDLMGVSIGWIACICHLVGMTVAVPMIEELFNRSLVLRSFQRPRPTTTGIGQVLIDMPLIGEWLIQSKMGEKLSQAPPVFEAEFHNNPLGRLTVFGLIMSTLIFMGVHQMVDWPGTVVCSLAYCFLLAATCRKGLGPVIWAHAITNGLLWAYVIFRNDWQFL